MEKPTAAHNRSVVGSSPAPATTKAPLSSWNAVLFLPFCNFLGRPYFPDTGLTQTVTQTGQKTCSEAVLPPPGCRLFQGTSEGVCQDLFHGPGGLLLGRCGDMGIGVQGEACREVPQHSGHRFDVHSILKSQGREGVPQIRKLFITTKTKRKKKPGSYRKTKTL